MRIVTRAELIKLPEGTVFAPYTPCAFGLPVIKGHLFCDSGDFWQVDLFPMDFKGAKDPADVEAILDACEAGASSPRMDFDSMSRGAWIGEDAQLFAVLEPHDVEDMIDRLQRALSTSTATTTS